MLMLNGKLITLLFLLFFYNVTIFDFLDSLLENRRVNKKVMFGVYFINAFGFMSIFNLSPGKVTCHYFFVIIVLFIELLFLYKETLLRMVFVTLAVSIHIMSVRAIALGVYSLALGITPFEANNSIYSIDTLNIALFVLVFCNLAVKKFIPARAVKIINQHKEQLIFMTTWLFISNGYFLFNSLIFTSKDTTLFSKYNIIAVSFALMVALYIVLLYTIRVGQLLGYKEKSDFLQNLVEDEKQFKNSVIDQAIIGFEANLTEDIVVTGFGSHYDKVKGMSERYSDLITNSIPHQVHADDVEAVKQFMSISHLLACYHKGEVEQSMDYRAKLPEHEDYIWIKAFFNLYKASATDSIMAFSYAKDIDVEKKLELEMKSRSERDTLTGLYNHGMTKYLVNDFIVSQDQRLCKGALLIIDVDNFKLINDNFGHGFGDEVLQDISRKLLSIFRCNSTAGSGRKEDDIVGRIGGDEFMVFVKTSDIEGIKERSKKICEMLKTTYTTAEGLDITISASVGIALVEGAEEDFKALYAKADAALYISKRKGKDAFSFYNGESFQGYQGER